MHTHTRTLAHALDTRARACAQVCACTLTNDLHGYDGGACLCSTEHANCKADRPVVQVAAGVGHSSLRPCSNCSGYWSMELRRVLDTSTADAAVRCPLCPVESDHTGCKLTIDSLVADLDNTRRELALARIPKTLWVHGSGTEECNGPYDLVRGGEIHAQSGGHAWEHRNMRFVIRRGVGEWAHSWCITGAGQDTLINPSKWSVRDGGSAEVPPSDGWRDSGNTPYPGKEPDYVGADRPSHHPDHILPSGMHCPAPECAVTAAMKADHTACEQTIRGLRAETDRLNLDIVAKITELDNTRRELALARIPKTLWVHGSGTEECNGPYDLVRGGEIYAQSGGHAWEHRNMRFVIRRGVGEWAHSWCITGAGQDTLIINPSKWSVRDGGSAEVPPSDGWRDSGNTPYPGKEPDYVGADRPSHHPDHILPSGMHCPAPECAVTAAMKADHTACEQTIRGLRAETDRLNLDLNSTRRELALARIPKTLWVHGSGTEECNGPYDLVRGGEIYAQSGGHAWEHRNMRFVIRRGVGEWAHSWCITGAGQDTLINPSKWSVRDGGSAEVPPSDGWRDSGNTPYPGKEPDYVGADRPSHHPDHILPSGMHCPAPECAVAAPVKADHTACEQTIGGLRAETDRLNLDIVAKITELDNTRRELALARIPKTLWVHGSGTEECNGPYDLVRGGEIYAQSGGHAWEHRNMRFVIRRGVGEWAHSWCITGAGQDTLIINPSKWSVRDGGSAEVPPSDGWRDSGNTPYPGKEPDYVGADRPSHHPDHILPSGMHCPAPECAVTAAMKADHTACEQTIGGLRAETDRLNLDLNSTRRELALARIPKTLWVHGSGTEECNGPYDLVRGGEIYAQSGGHAWEHRNMRFVIRRGVGEWAHSWCITGAGQDTLINPSKWSVRDGGSAEVPPSDGWRDSGNTPYPGKEPDYVGAEYPWSGHCRANECASKSNGAIVGAAAELLALKPIIGMVTTRPIAVLLCCCVVVLLCCCVAVLLCYCVAASLRRRVAVLLCCHVAASPRRCRAAELPSCRAAELPSGRAVRCGAVRCGAVRCGAVRCGAVRRARACVREHL